MPYIVNGQLVAEEMIRQEIELLSRDPQWSAIADEDERANRLRAAAEISAADKLLIAQIAAADPRPVDQAAVEREAYQFRTRSG